MDTVKLIGVLIGGKKGTATPLMGGGLLTAPTLSSHVRILLTVDGDAADERWRKYSRKKWR